jgi:hypothetical protein
MDEVFPVLAGIALGLATCPMRPGWLRLALIGIAGFGLGATASWISGELAISRVYVLVDAAQVIVAAVLSGFLARRWLHRHGRLLAR